MKCSVTYNTRKYSNCSTVWYLLLRSERPRVTLQREPVFQPRLSAKVGKQRRDDAIQTLKCCLCAHCTPTRCPRGTCSCSPRLSAHRNTTKKHAEAEVAPAERAQQQLSDKLRRHMPNAAAVKSGTGSSPPTPTGELEDISRTHLLSLKGRGIGRPTLLTVVEEENGRCAPARCCCQLVGSSRFRAWENAEELAAAMLLRLEHG